MAVASGTPLPVKKHLTSLWRFGNIRAMNWLDVTILVICLAGAIQGLVKGFVRQAFSLIGLVLAIILAFRYHTILGRYLEQWIDQPAIVTIISFVLVLVVIILLFKLIGLAARAAMSAVTMGWFDRLAGAVFGFFKAVLLVAVLFALLIVVTDRPSGPVAESRLAPSAIAIAGVIAHFFPEDVRERYLENEEKMLQRLEGVEPEEEELAPPEAGPEEGEPQQAAPGETAPTGESPSQRAPQTV